METTTTDATTVLKGAEAPSRSAADRAAITQDFDTFLRMLTAQARYQDPLEPIDASDYSAQLAQFSMVEQQVLSNDLLSSLTAALGASNMASLAGWVGMEGRAEAPVAFSGEAVTFVAEPLATADQAFLVVQDTDGEIVDRRQVPVANAAIEWDGKLTNGGEAAHGVYEFRIESVSNGDVVASEAAETFGRIVEARMDDGQVLLVLASGAVVPASDISALRDPRS